MSWVSVAVTTTASLFAAQQRGIGNDPPEKKRKPYAALDAYNTRTSSETPSFSPLTAFVAGEIIGSSFDSSPSVDASSSPDFSGGGGSFAGGGSDGNW